MAKVRVGTSTASSSGAVPSAAGERAVAKVRVGDRQLENSRLLAKLMDDAVKIPGTDIGIGLDALIGLFPGIGDSVGTVLSGYILVEAVRRRVPIPVLLRMAANLGFDTLLGTVPFVGDFFDVAFRANRMNVRLMERHQVDPDRVEKSSVLYLLAAVAIVVLTMVVLIAAALAALWLVVRILGGIAG